MLKTRVLIPTKFYKLSSNVFSRQKTTAGHCGRVDHLYCIEFQVPPRNQIDDYVGKPPYNILSKSETTFTTGILAHIPHSVKLRISREYQEPFIGLFINIQSKPLDQIQIGEIKGQFTPCLANQAQGQATASSSTVVHRQQCPANTHHHNSTVALHYPNFHVINVPFYKTKVPESIPDSIVSKEGVEYYESKCTWPDVQSHVTLVIRVVKTNYATLVEDLTKTTTKPKTEKGYYDAKPYFMSELLSDVTLQIGNTKFPAHRLILSSQSNYFAAMFSTPMRESKEGIVTIDDVDPEVMTEVLRFIYQHQVENLAKYATGLLVLADKYDIPELKDYCEKYLMETICYENAADMYDLSQSVGASDKDGGQLGRRAKQLIMWNKEQFVQDLDSFKTFVQKYPEVVFDMIRL